MCSAFRGVFVVALHGSFLVCCSAPCEVPALAFSGSAFLRPRVQTEGLVKHSSLLRFLLLGAVKLPISLKIKLKVHRLIDGLKTASCDISSWPV